jgi:hypothetical protein
VTTLTQSQRRTAARLYATLRDQGKPVTMPERAAKWLAQDLGIPTEAAHCLRPEIGHNIRLIDLCVLAAQHTPTKRRRSATAN